MRGEAELCGEDDDARNRYEWTPCVQVFKGYLVQQQQHGGFLRFQRELRHFAEADNKLDEARKPRFVSSSTETSVADSL